MKKTLIPYIYICDKTYIYKRISEKTIKTIIWYKLDFFSFKTIVTTFNVDEYNNKEVEAILEIIIMKLNKLYK